MPLTPHPLALEWVETKEPPGRRTASAVHHGVGNGLDGVVAILSKVLMLHTGLTLPEADQEIAQVVHNAFADLDLGTIADELRRKSVLMNCLSLTNGKYR